MKCLRTHYVMSQKTILATAVLFNISRKWNDDDDGLEDGDDETADDHPDRNFVVQDMAPASVRLRGQVERDRLKDAMPD